MNKQNIKNSKGITLVALIITIVVLLILAIVAIGAVKDSNIIAHAQDAGDSYTIGQEKEQLGLALSEWNLEKVIPGSNPVFKTVIGNALQGQIQPIQGNNDGPLTVTFIKTGNAYTVTKDGEITPITKGINLSSATLSIAPEKTAQLAATLTGITGNVTWTSSNTDIVIVTPSGDTLTATLTVGEGAIIGTTVEITATCGEYSTKCIVTVVEESQPLTVGAKAYQFGSQVALVTPDNKLVIFEESLLPEYTLQLTSDLGDYTAKCEGFDEDEKTQIQFLYATGMPAIMAYVGDNREKMYYAMILDGSNEVTISRTQYLENSEPLLTQYYPNQADYEYYFCSVTTGDSVIVFDYTNNKMMIYLGKSATWEKIVEGIPFEKVQNDTPINVVVNGESYTITTNAHKIITKNTDGSDTGYCVYIENEELYYNQNGVVEGTEVSVLSLNKFINTGLLPT